LCAAGFFCEQSHSHQKRSQKNKLTVSGNTKQVIQDYDTVLDNSIPFRKHDLLRILECSVGPPLWNAPNKALSLIAATRATRRNREWGYSTRRHMLEPKRPEAVLPDRALFLPTFIHFLIVNELPLPPSFSLSLSPSLPPSLSPSLPPSLPLSAECVLSHPHLIPL
jgi:hypothetical protein